jgi:tyrosyl-tRNA synthetase
LLIARKPENGGDKIYNSYPELEADFASGALHPGDLKPAVT